MLSLRLREMLEIEYLMGVQDKLPEGYKMNQGPGAVLAALGLYGDQTDNPQFSQPANIRSYTRPIGGDRTRTLGRYVTPYQNYDRCHVFTRNMKSNLQSI